MKVFSHPHLLSFFPPALIKDSNSELFDVCASRIFSM